MSPTWLFSVSLLWHLIILCSVFDIWFRSPVVPVTRSFAPDIPGPARRLVLFVADGLRADAFFDQSDGSPLTPFLRLVMERQGAWGVSHTHVPTESRPGHVALIGGLYEDPSAIARGWQENPVDFDTVFNQSSHTWAWGSPDILPMFARGATPHRVRTASYPSSFEDFSANDLTQLDTWVFDQVEAFIHEAYQNHSLQMELRAERVVLFLHLLGCDTNGHRHNPRSPEYQRNIRMVDQGIERMVELFDRYWRHDGRTAFVFTADHGMTDWGSHGAGMAHETETPLVVWGAGVRRPIPSKTKTSSSPPYWHMDHLFRSDVEQADVAPLMSVLLGTNIPKNSVGRLPVDYLDMSPDHKIKASLAVAQQMFEQFLVLQSGFAQLRLARLLHRPFSGMNEVQFQDQTDRVRILVSKNMYEKAQPLADDLWQQSFHGVQYYHQYYQLQLFVVTSTSYVSFILLTLTSVIKHFSIIVQPCDVRAKPWLSASFVAFSMLAGFLTLCQNVPYHYFIYYITPVILIRALCSEWSSMKVNQASLSLPVVVPLILVMSTELLICAFFDRRWLSLAIVLVTLLQRYLGETKSKLLRASWVICNLALCGFSFQPSVMKEHNPALVLLAGLGSALVSGWFTQKVLKTSMFSGLLVFLVTSGICSWISLIQEFRTLAQCVSWIVFLGGVPLALARPSKAFERLLRVSMALMSSYILLSLTYEGLFLLTLIITMAIYILMEFHENVYHQKLLEFTLDSSQPRKAVSIRDVFRSFLFLFFSIVSFFGTGNIASLNTFDPKSITTLVSVFSPFLMGGLLLSKVLIPFLVVACFMYLMISITRLDGKAMFLMVLLFSDWMSLHFFFLVQDQGSWAEIGTSLSHFIIAEGTVIFLQLFLVLARGLLEFRAEFVKNKVYQDSEDIEMVLGKSNIE
ncbi:hypothetical protein TCAL_00914 [Tigriopus californicus]|uniref:GPI ethanolamine phosphate transferase 1 n=1 Tax=Tigriopus californicus TaxID=6832 RepID=A0A553P7N7_TIGCA|nr:GPI ethanolamine phosphate transferase 1-like [Tigriopus californicus]TRY73706.1 hypothetical protein TCAL_00914 [Tigriopus californicus]|eukprot:TCALIF_00914-PA protein Name:"Similar to PIGN GPI ethanolamine phosphate transferase 1 (Homo sapiens)" AED:0.00 eAED:0.00 QI:0/-1/0/1/-1/1/1/0/913